MTYEGNRGLGPFSDMDQYDDGWREVMFDGVV